jgi:hypothetical protein
MGGVLLLFLFFSLLANGQTSSGTAHESISDILAGREESAGAGIQEGPLETNTVQEGPLETKTSVVVTGRPAVEVDSLLAEWVKEYRAVAAERSRLARVTLPLTQAREACRNRFCLSFFSVRLLPLQTRQNLQMTQYRERLLQLLKRCEDTKPPNHLCHKQFRDNLNETESVIAKQKSAVVIRLPTAFGIAGMVLSGVVLLVSVVAVILAFRAAHARVSMVLLACCILAFAGFRIAAWGTAAAVFGWALPYAPEVTDRISAIALTTALAVLALFWGRAVHEELYPSRVLLLASRVAVVALTAIACAYGFIMGFIAPNFPVADAGYVLLPALDVAISGLLVVYAALILHTVSFAGRREGSRSSHKSEATRNSIVLLVLAGLLLCFFVGVVGIQSYWTANIKFDMTATAWYQVLKLIMEFLIAVALLAIVVLSVWSPRHSKPQVPEDNSQRSELNDPLVPRQYADY